MPHFFLAPGALQGDAVTITGALARHLAGSLRYREADRLVVVSEGRRVRVMVTEATGQRVRGQVIETLLEESPEPFRVTMAQSILKSDHMDAVIQKAVELGATRIVPLITRRTVVRPRQDRASRQVARWRAIALEAAQQSERLIVPEVQEARAFSEWLRSGTGSPTTRWLLGEREEQRHLRAELALATAPSDVTLVIGPEGGFDPEEIEQARAEGFVVVSLGRAILRAETAALAALTILQYAWGNLGGPRTAQEPPRA